MNNDQYSNMMLEFAKLEAKIEKLERLLQPNKANVRTLWDEAALRKTGCLGDNSTPPKPFTALREVKDACN